MLVPKVYYNLKVHLTEYSGQTEPLNPGQTEPVIPGQTGFFVTFGEYINFIKLIFYFNYTHFDDYSC